jgi:molybdopterin-containing oxidoreductase family membrane subunit
LFKEFYWSFIISNYIGVLLPLLVIGIAKLRTITNITITAVIVVIALWLNRYIIVVPTLESPYLPIQDSRIEWLKYSATWVEWSLTAAGIAVFCLLFTLGSKFIPIVPVSGLQTEEKKEEAIV